MPTIAPIAPCCRLVHQLGRATAVATAAATAAATIAAGATIAAATAAAAASVSIFAAKKTHAMSFIQAAFPRAQCRYGLR